MITRLIADQWRVHTPEGDGEKRQAFIELKGVEAVDVEIRSDTPVTLRAVAEAGHSVFLGWGQIVSFNGRLQGFAALEVETDTPFSYRCDAKAGWLEKVDPTPMVVSLEQKASSPIDQLVRQELQRMLGQMQARDMFKSDEALEEFLDDIENGDLDFEAEPDPYGLGFQEQDLMPVEEAEPEPPQAEAPPPAPGDKAVPT